MSSKEDSSGDLFGSVIGLTFAAFFWGIFGPGLFVLRFFTRRQVRSVLWRAWLGVIGVYAIAKLNDYGSRQFMASSFTSLHGVGVFLRDYLSAGAFSDFVYETGRHTPGRVFFAWYVFQSFFLVLPAILLFRIG
ncbi:MAG: hypothetical protein IT381_30760, partial [Deltaproteobacteria bacterium]|nr:hypothetical protein [Deltaproteobacteria bacterium]